MTKGIMPLTQDAGIEVIIISDEEIKFRFVGPEGSYKWERRDIHFVFNEETEELEPGFYIGNEFFSLSEFTKIES